MARRKRKTDPITSGRSSLAEKATKRYRAAGYARLSTEDGGTPGAGTLESQKQLIIDYVESAPDMELAALFADNGETGTDFRRPGFESMMDRVRSGDINCIVVKDLSRFGRNYKETGNYLERIFPFLGVRFHSITDGFDTLTAENGDSSYIVPLKNLINEAYSRDISRKTACALHTKQQRGEYLGTWAPYGYKKSREDKHRLIPDPETAAIVQRIFRMRFLGSTYHDIVRTLNGEGIASPSKYLLDTGLCKNESYSDTIWTVSAVKTILKRQVYLGHMVQGMRRQSFCDGQKRHSLPRKDWIIVKDTHEPLIDADTFHACGFQRV